MLDFSVGARAISWIFFTLVKPTSMPENLAQTTKHERMGFVYFHFHVVQNFLFN